VTDHRVGMTLHKLELVMEGDLDEFVQALKAQQQQIDTANV
jgi:peptide chain release factor 1